MKSDLYDTLGVAPSATEEEIKKAFRRLALLCHPDRNLENPEAEERFKEANYAYSVLGNREKRGRYDLYRDFRMQSARWGLPATGPYERFLEDLFLNPSLSGFPQGIPLDMDFLARLHPIFNFSRASALFLRRLRRALREEQLLDGLPFFFFRSSGPVSFAQPGPFRRMFRSRTRGRSGTAARGGNASPVDPEPVRRAKRRSGDIEWVLPLTKEEAESGASLNVSFPGTSGWQQILLRVPRGIRKGTKLRIQKKGKWISEEEGRGDLYLEVVIR